jgi:hypothetical protein
MEITKHTFLLDENIIEFAQKGQDAYGNEDYACATLIHIIAQNCHKVVIDSYLKECYRKKLKNSRQPGGMMIIKLINFFIANSDKHAIPSVIIDLPYEDQIPTDDVPIVKRAVSMGAILVTSDVRLQEKIKKAKKPRNHNLKVLNPKEAIKHASTTS